MFENKRPRGYFPSSHLRPPTPVGPSDEQPQQKKKPVVSTRLLLAEFLDTIPTSISKAGQAFACIPCISGPTNYHYAVKSPAMQNWVLDRSTKFGVPLPSIGQVRDGLRTMEGRCLFDTRPARINLRTAWNPDYRPPVVSYNDYGAATSFDHFTNPVEPAIILALDTRRAWHAAVTRSGWTINPSLTTFLFNQVQQILPEPVRSETPEGPLASFRKLLRLDQPSHDAAWQTILDWTLAALRPPKDASFHDYPILNLVGPHNSGKSVTAKLLASLIDPSGAPLHSLPTTERRLHGLAATHHVLAFDDPGKINPEKSRHLSRLSSGVASLNPALQGMMVRPVILTTQNEKETRHLSHRVVDVHLPEVETRLPQEQIWKEFEHLRPALLGALLTLLVRDFDQPRYLLPNRKTEKQKIEESVPAFVAEQGGEWSGSVTGLKAALPFEVSIQALGRYLAETHALEVIHKKSNGNRRVVLRLTRPAVSEPQIATAGRLQPASQRPAPATNAAAAAPTPPALTSRPSGQRASIPRQQPLTMCARTLAAAG